MTQVESTSKHNCLCVMDNEDDKRKVSFWQLWAYLSSTEKTDEGRDDLLLRLLNWKSGT